MSRDKHSYTVGCITQDCSAAISVRSPARKIVSCPLRLAAGILQLQRVISLWSSHCQDPGLSDPGDGSQICAQCMYFMQNAKPT